MEIKFHTLERTFWLEARTSRPFGLGHISRVIMALCFLTPSAYNFYTKKIHINLPAVKKMRERGNQPPALEIDSLDERVYVNIERQAVRKAIHEAGEDIYHPLTQYEALDEVMRQSNRELTPDSHWVVEKLRDKASEISAGF
jgi:hypothetical protein